MPSDAVQKVKKEWYTHHRSDSIPLLGKPAFITIHMMHMSEWISEEWMQMLTVEQFIRLFPKFNKCIHSH